MYQVHHTLHSESRTSSALGGLPRKRPPIPSLFTGEREDTNASPCPPLASPFDYSDLDQKVSRQLLALDDGAGSDLAATSAPVVPDYIGLPPLSPIFPTLDQGSTSMSPAAMFLSAFSPAVSATQLPDDEGEEVEGYRLGSIIGYGGFSTIRRASSPSGGTVAVKIVRRSDMTSQLNPAQAQSRLENEASIWKMLSHEHVLPLFHSAHTPYADFFFMLLCPAGTLYDILKRDGRPALPHDDAGMMFRQVVRGVRYLHEQMGLVHADLKLENVLVDEMGVCRITDFGMTHSIGEESEDDPSAPQPVPHGVRRQFSLLDSRARRASPLLRGRGSLRAAGHMSLLHPQHPHPRRRESTPLPAPSQVQDNRMHTLYEFPPGSLPYAAPELLHTPDVERPYRPHPAQDVWALGVMLYALLTGSLPFSDSFEPRLTMKILHGAFEMPKDVGRGAELVLRGCLESSVAQRWTTAAIDEVSWSVGWASDADESSSGGAESELEKMVHETHADRASKSSSRSRSRAPPAIPEDGSEDALPELEYDAGSAPGMFVRSASSRSRSTGTAPFSPFTNVWSEVDVASTCPIEVPLSLASTSPRSRERSRGRHANKGCAGRSPSIGPIRSRSPSVAPTSPILDEVRGRQGNGASARPMGHALGLEASGNARARRAGSQPPAYSAPWAVPTRAKASVCVSPTVSVARSTPHTDGGFVLNSGVAAVNVRSRSADRV